MRVWWEWGVVSEFDTRFIDLMRPHYGYYAFRALNLSFIGLGFLKNVPFFVFVLACAGVSRGASCVLALYY